MSATARPPAARDPGATRERILAAALTEFADKGLAGARVDAIARRARINKRMLYHYFGNKDDLFREILRRKVATRAAAVADAPDAPGEFLPYFYEVACGDLEWVRLLKWEALEGDPRRPLAGAERRQAFRKAIAKIRRAQAAGGIAPDLDPGQCLLALLGITAFPLAFPQIARLVTGRAPTDPVFHRARVAFLRRFAGHLGPGARVSRNGRGPR
jgi:TetR/AcrR family transcriptional regulator